MAMLDELKKQLAAAKVNEAKAKEEVSVTKVKLAVAVKESKPGKPGRPAKYGTAMSSAERQREYRQRKKDLESK